MSRLYHIPDEDFADYFLGPPTKDDFFTHYDNTENLYNLYDFIRFFMFDSMSKKFGMHYSILGCKRCVKTINIKRNEPYKLDLTDIIGNGELLYINYSPVGTFEQRQFPVKMYSGITLTNTMDNIIDIFPYSPNAYSNTIKAEVQVLIYYAPPQIKEDLSANLMLDSFKYFYNDDYRYSIISAQNAIEIETTRFLDKLARNGKDRKDLMKISRVYSTLFELMPFLASLSNFILPKDFIMEDVKHLNNLRNLLLHTGKIADKDFSDKKITDCLLSAFFLYKYFKLGIPMINKYPK